MVAKVSPYQFDPVSWRMVVVLVIWMPQNSFALTPVDATEQFCLDSSRKAGIP